MLIQTENLVQKFENRAATKNRGRRSRFSPQEHAEAIKRAMDAGWEKMNTEQRREFVNGIRFKHGNEEIRIGLSTLASWIDMIKEPDITVTAAPKDGKHFSEEELLAAIAKREMGNQIGSREALIAALGKAERARMSAADLDMAAGLLVAERLQARDTQDLQVLLGRQIANRVLAGDFPKQQ